MNTIAMKNFLIFGNGWIGNKFKEYLNAPLSQVNITDKVAVQKELNQYKPDVVINTAGKTGKPNIDLCEDHKLETIDSNITGALVLLKECTDKNILLVHLSSGCIFSGASPKNGGFTEEDEPNPVSFYSWTKMMADDVLKKFPTLIVRLRMPVDSIPSPRNLITKLAGYKNIIDVENSVTIIDDFLGAVKSLIEKKKTGIYNITNPGTAKHKDILQWYKEIVDPKHTYNLITAEELFSKGLAKAGRSNCILNTKKLENEGIHLRDAKTAIIECLKEYRKRL